MSLKILNLDLQKISKLSTKIKKVKPQVRKQLFENVINEIGEGPLACLQQLEENSNDAGGLNILIDTTHFFSITDNGIGMTDEGIEAFISMGFSHWPSKEAKGQFGTGAKTIISLAKKMIIFTACHDHPDKIKYFEVTDQELLDAWAHERDVDVNVHFIPRSKVDFPYTTGTIIKFDKFRPNKRPSSNYIQENMAEYLDPHVADKVLVDGKKLQQRDLLGEIIYWEEPYKELDIYCKLAFVKKPKRTDKPSKIGSKGPICTISSFVAQLPDELKQRVPLLLTQREILGTIDIKQFNKYGSNVRTQFSKAFYQSVELKRFIDWLELWLGPQLERAMGIVEEEESVKQSNQIVEDFCSSVQQRTGELIDKEVAKQKSTTKLRISPARLELLLEKTFIYQLTNIDKKKGKIIWDATESGGNIKPLSATTAEYTAGSEIGIFRLIAYQEKNPDMKAIASVQLVKYKKLRINPATINLEPNGRQVQLMIENRPPGTDEKGWVWIAEECGGRISSSYGFSIQYTPGPAEGKFRIKVSYKPDTSFSAECRINIVKQDKPDHPKAIDQLRKAFKIPAIDKYPDVFFELRLVNWSRQNKTSELQRGLSKQTLSINTGQKGVLEAQQKGKSTFFEFLKNEIALNWCEVVDKSMSPMDTLKFRAIILEMLSFLEE
jgi:hypothetical protein